VKRNKEIINNRHFLSFFSFPPIVFSKEVKEVEELWVWLIWLGGYGRERKFAPPSMLRESVYGDGTWKKDRGTLLTFWKSFLKRSRFLLLYDDSVSQGKKGLCLCVEDREEIRFLFVSSSFLLPCRFSFQLLLLLLANKTPKWHDTLKTLFFFFFF
jgi:hypothetical protein